MKRRWLCLAGALMYSSLPVFAQNPRIIDWVESAPQSDNNKIALGYPAPLPVDTPLPFDGFRSYSGLHTRHMDLAASTPWVHPVAIGTTHAGQTIWAYRLGDENLITRSGLPEQAMLTNGGIHAREWQTPETVTGVMELLVEKQNDQFLYSYLRDNANVIVIPVLNVDGFRQTQRFPTGSWMGTDPGSPESSPRDGRMRRKNMLLVDEDLATQADHLNGVDLNRNSPPYWSTSPNNSSSNVQSIVHHGSAAQSEPEIQALDAAAQLGPTEQLSMYTDVHSFTRVLLWVRNSNERLAQQTESLLRTFSNHHRNFPAGKVYGFNGANSVATNRGIGSTDEYFTHVYQVPAWTLEVEPGNSGGVEYGGLGRNGHDGFILPESQITRVRTQLAQTFAIAYYRQAGPPSITAFQLVDDGTGATVFMAEWERLTDTERLLFSWQAQAVQFDRDYTAWISFDKPMRWQEQGEVAVLPGQFETSLDVEADVLAGDQALTTSVNTVQWLKQAGGSPDGYRNYINDTLAVNFRHPANAANLAAVPTAAPVHLALDTGDMTSLKLDSNPATVARWQDGAWSGYENEAGQDLTDSGGSDTTLQYQMTPENLGDPFVIEAGTSSAWFDPSRDGEGFVLEILANNKAVMYWFTYDDEGEQDWYLAVGNIRGNHIEFKELLQISGGQFGPGFDPDQVSETVVGSASFTWSGCGSGIMKWQLGESGSENFRNGRMNLSRLSRLLGIDCGQAELPPSNGAAYLSGSWFDPSHAGEGYVLEILIDGRALVYWFSFDANGKRRWFFGIGELNNAGWVFEEMITTRGALFGAAFDPTDIEQLPWGSLTLSIQCEGGEADFTPIEQGFPAGMLNLARLTYLEGLTCP